MKIIPTLTRLPADVLIFLIELYRTYVSPTRMPVCRFTPTCSEYAVTALRTRGLVVGLGLTVVRLAKCAPWHPGGWDPVPERKQRARRDEHGNVAVAESTRETGPLTDSVQAPKACKGSPSAVIGDTNDGSA
ncbi:membrane protein insertion efficiency factor YidD [Nocardia donostiensis]|uniref:Putative membrane protein insertion efficiency factor n=1 Tax=Nocardia donostiensis TaxID=1538463 RepID=A0A1V2TI03_9NOCA|nr:membrane protein insertion efficiency factor YidD [Nocardia donostiensis]ONM49073.1 membrane protein insertion efficiency factor YidD [Nocardia donostiensis]OQS14091.1 membrane protein insertion efficiency factor YidD [Nocardia donostiensis]OQS19748.1 membrane protein insertion efficiency factor YidD [Nocardia donostiensis]